MHAVVNEPAKHVLEQEDYDDTHLVIRLANGFSCRFNEGGLAEITHHFEGINHI
jgi:hypothetical protein